MSHSDSLPADSISSRAMAAAKGPAPSSPAPWLESLNPEQREAVERTEGPVLVLAGAGTGKTKTLTCRIAHILASHKAWPSQILAVTFTNKAAREMRERVESLIGEEVGGLPWLGTFHSIGAKILRRHAELANLTSRFTIIDADDQVRLLRQLIRTEGIDDKRWPARQFAGLIDDWKNRALSPEQVGKDEAESFADGKARDIYTLYQKRMKIMNVADFGDLLCECIRIFEENPDILEDYQRRFRYMLVDEYQDTNKAQYSWLRLLSRGGSKSGGPNLCCVGDDDQSIYGWRGAQVENILRFDQHFPGALIVRLERNYRSTRHILSAASHVISRNESRLGKTLFPASGGGEEAEKLTVGMVLDPQEEALEISDEIEALHHRGISLNEIAVLVRTASQMHEFENRFLKAGIPYRVFGGPRFYERQEIRDALAYLRCVWQPSDDMALERIVNKPRRGIGNTTLRRIREVARLDSIPLMVAIRNLLETEELRPAARKSLGGLLSDFSRWSELAEDSFPSSFAERVLDDSGYTRMLHEDHSEDALGRLENLKELIHAMAGYESLGDFLEHAALATDSDARFSNDAVALMTLHAAKGLEFDTIFLPGWEEGLFPHQRVLDEDQRMEEEKRRLDITGPEEERRLAKAGLEEERRLAYVGITRARRRCHIRCARRRRIHGSWDDSFPSRFLNELSAEDVEIRTPSRPLPSYGHRGAYESPGWRRVRERERERVIEACATSVSMDSPSSASSGFEVGERVFHQKFGMGCVLGVSDDKLTIEFDRAGQKRVLDRFVEKAN